MEIAQKLNKLPVCVVLNLLETTFERSSKKNKLWHRGTQRAFLAMGEQTMPAILFPWLLHWHDRTGQKYSNFLSKIIFQLFCRVLVLIAEWADGDKRRSQGHLDSKRVSIKLNLRDSPLQNVDLERGGNKSRNHL